MAALSASGIPPGRLLVPYYSASFLMDLATLQVHIHLSTITLSDSPDFPIWNSAGIGANNNNKFVISKIYDSIRDSRPKVFWNKAVWFSKGIPKHKTLTWLFLLNRCPTRDRLLSWGLQTDPSCLLCNNHPESRNHIFSIVASQEASGGHCREKLDSHLPQTLGMTRPEQLPTSRVPCTTFS
ncbi:hypothetical protein Bca101_073416 [Brassica carinata]